MVVEGVTQIGEDCEVDPFASLGAPPQHSAYKGEPTRLVIGDRNLIREHVTMHTGTPIGRGVTTVGSDGLFCVGCHVAHDCIVGDHVVLINSATLGGHVVDRGLCHTWAGFRRRTSTAGSAGMRSSAVWRR